MQLSFFYIKHLTQSTNVYIYELGSFQSKRGKKKAPRITQFPNKQQMSFQTIRFHFQEYKPVTNRSFPQISRVCSFTSSGVNTGGSEDVFEMLDTVGLEKHQED